MDNDIEIFQPNGGNNFLPAKEIISKRKGFYLVGIPGIVGGLWEVRFVIVKHGFLLHFAETKQEALGWLRKVDQEVLDGLIEKRRAEKEGHDANRRRFREEMIRNSRISSIAPARKAVYDKTEGKCFYCEVQLMLEGDWHVDHMHPKSRGGSNDISNLAPSCPTCNMKKGRKTVEEFKAA